MGQHPLVVVDNFSPIKQHETHIHITQIPLLSFSPTSNTFLASWGTNFQLWTFLIIEDHVIRIFFYEESPYNPQQISSFSSIHCPYFTNSKTRISSGNALVDPFTSKIHIKIMQLLGLVYLTFIISSWWIILLNISTKGEILRRGREIFFCLLTLQSFF